MIIVIDGYNVLKLVYGTTNITQAIRSTFCRQLEAYGKMKGHTLLLVFDGGPYNMSTSERHGQVTVVYVGYRETADDYIKRYLDKHHHREVLLVTHDRELVSHALQYDVPTIDVWPFYERVIQKKQAAQSKAPLQQTQARKLHHEEIDVELDALLTQADILEKVEYKPPKERVHGVKKLSKLQKSLESLLKKL